MTTILLVFVAVVLFAIGIITPHHAGKIQRKTNEKAGWLKRVSNWLWDPITWWSKKSIEFTRKSMVKITDWGKQTRKRVDADEKNRRKN